MHAKGKTRLKADYIAYKMSLSAMHSLHSDF